MDKLFLEQTVHVIDRLPENSVQNYSVADKFVSTVNLTLNSDSNQRIKQQHDNMLNRPINSLDGSPVIMTNRPLDNSHNLVHMHPDFIQQIGQQMLYILRHGANFENISIDSKVLWRFWIW